MRRQVAAALAAGALAVLLSGIASAAVTKKPATRSENRAARAAVAATRGGKAVKVARETEKGATWEVEVLMPRARRLDVLLDARFRAINVSDEREPDEMPAGRKGSGTARSKPAGSGRQAHLAAQAAAKAVGGGILIDVDRESEKGSAWEVEFMKLDGKRINVLLDDRYRLIRVTRGKKAN